MLKRIGAALGGGKVNKMWAGALAPAAVKSVEIAFGIDFAPEIEVALLMIITGGAVWRIPNRPN